MKNTANRIWKSCVAMLLVLCMVLSLPLSALAAAAVPSTAEKGTVNVLGTEYDLDVNKDGKITYAAFGDSVTNGYGLPGYRYEDGTNPYGFLREVEGGYPDLIRDELEAQGHTVELHQMAVSGYRMEELHWALSDETYVADTYHTEHFANWNTNIIHSYWKRYAQNPEDAEAKQIMDTLRAYEAESGLTYRYDPNTHRIPENRPIADRVIQLEYRKAVKEADLITIDLGTNNFGTFMVQAIQQAMGMKDGSEMDISLDQFLDPETAVAMEEILGKMVAGMVGEGSSMYDLTYTMMESLIYGYLGFTEHYDGAIDAIYAINPDVKIVVIDMYAMISGIDMLSEKLGSAIDLDALFNMFVDCSNLYTRELSPYATKVTHVTLPEDPELAVEYYLDYSENKAAGKLTDSEHLDPVAYDLMNEFVMEMMFGDSVEDPSVWDKFFGEDGTLSQIKELDETVNSVQKTVQEDVILEEVEPGIKDGVKLIYDAVRVPEAIKGYRLINMGLDESLTGEERKKAIIEALADEVGAEMAEIAYIVATAYYAEFNDPENASLSATEKDTKGMIAAYASQLDGDLETAAAAYKAMQVYDDVLYETDNNEKEAAIAALADFLMSSNDQLTEEEAKLVAEGMHGIYDGDATAEQHKKASIYALTTKQLKDNADSTARNITQEEAAAIYTCYEGNMDGKYEELTVYTALTVLMVLDDRFPNLEEAEDNFDSYLSYKRLPSTLEKIAGLKVMYLDKLMTGDTDGGVDAMVGDMAEKFTAGTLVLEEPVYQEPGHENETEEEFNARMEDYKADVTLSVMYFRFMALDGVFTHPSFGGQAYMYAQAKAVLDELYEAEPDSKIVVDADSKLLVLGDFIATDEGYVNALAKNLNLKEENVTNLSNENFRIDEVRALLDSSYARDAYGQAVLADVTEDYVAAVKENDVIVLHLGAMNMGLIYEQLYRTMFGDGNTYAMRYEPIGNMKIRDLGIRSDNMMARMEAMVKGDGSDTSAAAMMLIFKTYGYGYTTFADCLDNTVETIQALNPDANIVLVGQYDLLGNYVFNSEDLTGESEGAFKLHFGDFVEHAQKLMNKHMQLYAEMTDNVTYADVYSDFEGVSDLFFELVDEKNAFKRVPTEAGYAEMTGKISCALTAHVPADADQITWGEWEKTDTGYTVTAEYDCLHCGEHISGDAYVSVTRDVYCDQEGTLTYTAFVPGYEYPEKKTETVTQTGHTPGDAVKENEKPATCAEEGSYEEVVYCSVCEKEMSRTEKMIEKLTTHTPAKAVKENEKAATCDKAGSYDEVVYCSVCEKELSREEKTTDKLSTHTPGKAVKENEKAATCAAAGSYDEVVYCSVCKAELSRTAKAIDKLTSHTPGKAVKENEVAATCAKAGSYDEVVYCSVCKAELSRNTVTTDKLTAHTPRVLPAKPANCAETGLTEGSECAVCGLVLKAQSVIPSKGGHTPVTVPGKAATCTEKGLSDGSKCSVCGQILKEQKELIAKGHTYKDGKCTECGVKDPSAQDPAVNEVVRVYGENRYATSLEVADTLKEILGVEKFNTVVVASGSSFADALAGSHLANQKNAPILLVNAHTVESVKAYIVKNLVKGGTVYLLGGESAVPAAMEANLSGYTVIRLKGDNRYDTNLAILMEAGTKAGDEILVCTGTGFADSLSASAAGRPILLVRNKLFDNQKAYLKSLGTNNKFIIIGGESAVSKELAEELKIYGSVDRVGGANRFETSTLLAEKFFDKPSATVLAYAKKFPDGLCGGPVAYALNAPLILTQSGREEAAAKYAAENKISAGYILGGEGLISDASGKLIFRTDKIVVK